MFTQSSLETVYAGNSHHFLQHHFLLFGIRSLVLKTLDICIIAKKRVSINNIPAGEEQINDSHSSNWENLFHLALIISKVQSGKQVLDQTKHKSLIEAAH